jgi:hypothetical protein
MAEPRREAISSDERASNVLRAAQEINAGLPFSTEIQLYFSLFAQLIGHSLITNKLLSL